MVSELLKLFILFSSLTEFHNFLYFFSSNCLHNNTVHFSLPLSPLALRLLVHFLSMEILSFQLNISSYQATLSAVKSDVS